MHIAEVGQIARSCTRIEQPSQLGTDQEQDIRWSHMVRSVRMAALVVVVVALLCFHVAHVSDTSTVLSYLRYNVAIIRLGLAFHVFSDALT